MGIDQGNMWMSAFDALPSEKEVAGSVDHQLKRASVIALLSISQELSRLNTGECGFAEDLFRALEALKPPKAGPGVASVPSRIR